MKRVVSLMHRQAVKVKAEGLFFKVRQSAKLTFLFILRALWVHAEGLITTAPCGGSHRAFMICPGHDAGAVQSDPR